jgi:hypothetical protein
MAAKLDAEGSERYLFAQDYKPAINSAVEWLQAVFNKAFSERKLSEESLGELTTTSIFQTNSFSRWSMDASDLGHGVWTILSVNPEPIIHPSNSTITTTANPEDSLYRSDVSYISSIHSAKRLTKEEWELNAQNVFSAGNTILTNGLKSYAYLNKSNYGSSNYVNKQEFEIRPQIVRGFISVSYLRYPSPINSTSDVIEFPETMTNLVAEKALNFISVKGEQGNLYSATSEDVSVLVKMMM